MLQWMIIYAKLKILKDQNGFNDSRNIIEKFSLRDFTCKHVFTKF